MNEIIDIELITPETAKEYLKNNNGNRTVRKWWVDELSKYIKKMDTFN